MNEELHRAIASLTSSPMFQLSTAGQELFHTNMLYWLAVNRAEESRAVWEAFGIDAPVPGGVDPLGSILREWHHIDLYVDTGMPGRTLVLENKLLAVPDRHQLARYHDSLVAVPGATKAGDLTRWRVLSLIPPSFELPQPWLRIGYDDLLPALVDTAANLSGHDGSLLEQYVQLVSDLVSVAQLVDPVRHLDQPIAMEKDLSAELESGRLLGLVRKIQMSRCAEMIERRIRDELGLADATVEAGISRTKGALQFWAPNSQGRHFGWQVEGDQFRLVGIHRPGRVIPRAKREEIMASEHGDYFDFDGLSAGNSVFGTDRSRKTWLGYEPDFVYQYRPLLPHTSWTELVDLCIAASARAISYTSAVG